jgi:hypothetical protein
MIWQKMDLILRKLKKKNSNPHNIEKMGCLPFCLVDFPLLFPGYFVDCPLPLPNYLCTDTDLFS